MDNGLDVYLSSKSLATLFIMKQRLKPETSYTLAGVKQGKRVYKNTYALRF
jgi:NMD protein affecting ribosome stability and mRNA decay